MNSKWTMEYQIQIKLNFDQLLYLATQLSESDKQRLAQALTKPVQDWIPMSKVEETDAIYNHLDLAEEYQLLPYDALPSLPQRPSSRPSHLKESLNAIGGIWEDDETEPLEVLLNGLTA